MIADTLLSQLTKVRTTSNGEWVACCPAHDDRLPSLAIKQCDDGRVLVHCFAGCDVEEVVGAVGLSLGDLMPERLSVEGLKRVPFNPRTVLEAIGNNSMLIAFMAKELAHGQTLTEADKDKLFELAGEIQEAISYATR